MTTTELASAHQAFSGLRPIQLRRDLADIADLIEFCFASTLDAAGRSAIQEMRFVSRSRPLSWVLGGLGRLMQGFVWIERDRLVGNVSVSPAPYGGGWIVANVAVYPDYRRRGIARKLVQAALDLTMKQGKFALLQVDADNVAARALYEGLGFREERVFVRWRRMTHHHTPPPLPQMPLIRRLARREIDPLYALAQQLRPNERGGMGWLRPTTVRSLRPPRWGRLKRVVTGASRDFWIVPGAGGSVEAALIAESRIGGLTAVFDALVCPERQGELEAPLIHDAIRRLGGRFHPLVTDHPADDPVMSDVLRQYHFRPERTLMHMIRPAQQE